MGLKFLLVMGWIGVLYSHDVSAGSCAQRLKALKTRTLERGSNPVVLDPGTHRFAISALVETGRGKLYLALGGYRSEHRLLHEAFMAYERVKLLQRFQYRFVGEMALLNSKRRPNVGSVVLATPTSSFYQRVLSGIRGNQNDVHFLRIALQSDRLLWTRYSRYLTYDEAKSRARIHVMTEMDGLKDLLDQMKSQRLADPDETFRHFVGRNIQKVVTELTEDFEDAPRENWMRVERALSLREQRGVLIAYLTWLLNDGYYREQLRHLIPQLQRFPLYRPCNEDADLIVSIAKELVGPSSTSPISKFSLLRDIQILRLR